MDHLFLECAVRAALLVAGTALVLYTMRVKAAAAKHSVWASVVLLMLVLPIWTAWGPKAPLRLLLPHLLRKAVHKRLHPAAAKTSRAAEAGRAAEACHRRHRRPLHGRRP